MEVGFVLFLFCFVLFCFFEAWLSDTSTIELEKERKRGNRIKKKKRGNRVLNSQ